MAASYPRRRRRSAAMPELPGCERPQPVRPRRPARSAAGQLGERRDEPSAGGRGEVGEQLVLHRAHVACAAGWRFAPAGVIETMRARRSAGSGVRAIRPSRSRDLPAIARDGTALSRGWWAMPGAIGVILYLDVAPRRGGSLSVWESEDDLRRFVRLPRHLAIMRAHRGRVSVRAATWRMEPYSTREAWAQGAARLTPPAAG